MTAPALVTRWPSLTARTGTRLETTWPEWFAGLGAPAPLALRFDARAGHDVPDKARLPGWSAAVFHGDRRTNAACDLVTALVLDYDGGTTLEQAAALWGAYSGFIHTTPSHQVEPGVDRFRVILPLHRAVTAAEYPRLWQWARAQAQAAGHTLDDAPKDPARLWFLPAALPEAPYETRLLHGTALDPDAVLQTVPATSGEPTTPGIGYAHRALERACTAICAAPEGTRNATLNKEAFSLAGLVAARALDHDATPAALQAAGRTAGLTESEIRRALESGFRAGAQKPRTVPRSTSGRRSSSPPAPDPTAGPPTFFRLTDYGNAERLVAQHGQDLRFCGALGWLAWDGQRWRRDDTGEVMRRAKPAGRPMSTFR